MTLQMTSFSSTQLTELSQLHTFLGFLQKRNFLKHQKTGVLLHDVYVTSSIYANHPSSINLF